MTSTRLTLLRLFPALKVPTLGVILKRRGSGLRRWGLILRVRAQKDDQGALYSEV